MMKFFTGIAFALSILSSTSLYSKEMGLDISYAQFMDDEGDGYFEIYFALAGSSIDFKDNGKGKFSGGVEVTVSIMKDSNYVAAEKFLITSPELADTTDHYAIYVNQARFALKNDDYKLIVDLKDINEEQETYKLTQDLTIDVAGKDVGTSDLIILDSYYPAKEGSIFAKSGYDLLPMVNSGSYYFTEAVEKVSFYIEIYNTNTSLGAGEPYAVKYYIKKAENDNLLDQYTSITRKEASPVQPILAGFDISKLPTGNFDLVVEALDKEGKPFLKKSINFYRKNSIAPITLEDVESVKYQGTFADRINQIDSLYLYTQYLFPISSEAEQNYQKSLLAKQNLSDLKRYFFVFWSQRNSLDPESAWKEYYGNVRIVNKKYTSRLRKGYMTDRGRVYLTYGQPDAVVERRFEPGLPPYEMWQYNAIVSPYVINQVNKFFVFAEFSRSTNEYRLLHSTAIGELNNRRWKYQLARGGYGSGGDIDQNSINSGDDFGSRLNNNLIIQGSQNNR